MLVVLDTGNTNIVGGVFKNGQLLHALRIRTVPGKTEDEYGVIVRALLEDRGVKLNKINRVIISSVVPQMNAAMEKMAMHLFNVQPVFLGPSVYDKLPLKVVAAHEIGSDLVANSVAAWSIYKEACLIIDFGTALSFTAVDSSAAIIGVSIAPGLGTAAASLSKTTAQLPTVALEAPPSAMGRNTVEAIQAGVVLGYTGLVKYMIDRIKLELGGAKVIATGGLCRILPEIDKLFDRVEQNLTLLGLAETEKYLY